MPPEDFLIVHSSAASLLRDEKLSDRVFNRIRHTTPKDWVMQERLVLGIACGASFVQECHFIEVRRHIFTGRRCRRNGQYSSLPEAPSSFSGTWKDSQKEFPGSWRNEALNENRCSLCEQ